ncbi:MAG: DUF3592 domain-containing protein, partial [Chitinivibrionales bacterium]|nr:DUF3592 domain-containing protein [Chitinivibrionales bacterium]
AMTKYLIKKGAKDPRPAPTLGSTVDWGSARDVMAVVNMAASPQARRDSLQNGLALAAMRGRRDVVRKLLAEGADINWADATWGWTPLMHAAHAREMKTVKLLVKRGADVNAVDKHGENAVFRAYRSKAPEIAYYLIRKGGADIRPEGVESATITERWEPPEVTVKGVVSLILFILAFSFLVLPFAFIPTIIAVVGLLKYRDTSDYVRTTGTIASSTVKAKSWRWSRYRTPVVEYAYEVDGKEYRKPLKFPSYGGTATTVAWDMAALFPEGRHVTVLHSPHSPETSVLSLDSYPLGYFFPKRWYIKTVVSALSAGILTAAIMAVIQLL